jgi:hypothetical protein
MNLLLSICFVTTGLNRLYFKNEMIKERERIFPELPLYTIYFVPIFEILTGILIWTKYKNIVLIIWILGVFLFILSLISRKSERQNIINTYKDVFILKSTTTSIVLHLLWVLLIIFVIINDFSPTLLRHTLGR